LNESFVYSPSHEAELEVQITPLDNKKSSVNITKQPSEENNKNISNFTQHDTGYISRFSTLSIASQESDHLQENEEDKKSTAFRQVKTRTQLFATTSTLNEASDLSERGREHAIPSVFQSKDPSGHTNSETTARKPLASMTRQPLSIKKNDVETKEIDTPFKINESQSQHQYQNINQHQFVTPSAPKPFTSLNATSNTGTCDRDTSKRKVLFTTPIARPFATPIDKRSQFPQPSTLKKLSPIKEPSLEKSSEEKRNVDLITINKIEYEVGKKIGSGGSSSVFLATGRKTGKECAIKAVNLVGVDPQTVEGYINETKLLAKLQGDKTIVTLFDYCHLPKEKKLFMVMEKGESDLHRILQGFTTHVPLYILMKYWHQMLEAVNYIHQNGVIHSDLKPGK
jgi:serine/threonine-protein kinase TTK/MPS1